MSPGGVVTRNPASGFRYHPGNVFETETPVRARVLLCTKLEKLTSRRVEIAIL